MATQNPPHAPQRRASLIKRVLLGLLVLLIGAVVWDVVRSTSTPPTSEIAGTTIDGKPWALADHKGKNPVIVNFFGTWCGPCKMELPHLIALKEKYKDRGVELVLITRETAAEVRQSPEFLRMPVTLLTDGSPVFDRYHIDAVPQTYMFDRSGKSVYEVQGYTEDSLVDLEKKLSAL